MDPVSRILVQAAIWFRRPPSRAHVAVILVAVAAAFAVVGVERWLGWPGWARTDRSVVVIPR
ncbi:hypothetical protein [Neoroseomonas soli]|uniref:Uncharacterized protein n=1 Tax=Neoroseomonas soli TaxID=1081025 RepID=A0A9X9X196_9PROT|nr:hypothetical protein [Neoroseomonas soli]MBR0673175.1 hypothetical protein [Neoroseomonas soli]